MPPTRFILLVEDDRDQIGVWNADIKEFNRVENRPFDIELISAGSLQDASDILVKNHIDAAIVDLRIPGNSSGKVGPEMGNEALKKIIETISGPTALFSAHVAEAAEFVASTPIRSFKKEEGQTKAIVDWFCEHAQLMTAIGQTVSDMRRETARIFAGTIWRRWDQTKNLGLTDEVLRHVVTRQVVSHIGEQLSLPLNNAPLYHPYEFYFEPPLRTDRLHTGDLLSLDDGVHVILTAQCDMVREYPERILLAKCKEIPNWANKSVEKQKDIARQASLKSHFLPVCGNRGPWLADFKCLATINQADAAQQLTKRFASIAPQFVPNLIQRFSAFVGRIGQPDLM